MTLSHDAQEVKADERRQVARATRWLSPGERLEIVSEVQAGETVTAVARRHGVSRQTVHLWKARFSAEGTGGLSDRPRGHRRGSRKPTSAHPAPVGSHPSRAVEFTTTADEAGRVTILPRIQRLMLGPDFAGRSVRVRASTAEIQVFTGKAVQLRTPSKLSLDDLHSLWLRGGETTPRQPAGGETTERVSQQGVLHVAGTPVKVGRRYRGAIVTLRVVNNSLHVLHQGMLVMAVPLPRVLAVGATLSSPALPWNRTLPTAAGPTRVERVVSAKGTVQVTGEVVSVGRSHAGKVATIAVGNRFHISIDGAKIGSRTRTELRPVRRWNANRARRTQSSAL